MPKKLKANKTEDNNTEIIEILTRLETKLEEIEKKTKKIEDAIYGNGKIGLITEIEILKNNNCNKKDTHKIFFAGIVGGGFSFVFSIIKSFLKV